MNWLKITLAVTIYRFFSTLSNTPSDTPSNTYFDILMFRCRNIHRLAKVHRRLLPSELERCCGHRCSIEMIHSLLLNFKLLLVGKGNSGWTKLYNHFIFEWKTFLIHPIGSSSNSSWIMISNLWSFIWSYTEKIHIKRLQINIKKNRIEKNLICSNLILSFGYHLESNSKITR